LPSINIKIKKDKYFQERGGTAKIINVKCANCGSLLFTYQKDGPGWLKRCYLNRIILPENIRACRKTGTSKSRKT